MKKLILFFCAISFVACNSDDDNADIVSKYNLGNKSEFFKHYWKYAGPYKYSGSSSSSSRNLNLGNGELSVGDIIHFGDKYLDYYNLDYGTEEVFSRDLWYDENGILNIMNLKFMVDDKYLEQNYQKRFPFKRHETNDTILLLDRDVTYYLLRSDSL